MFQSKYAYRLWPGAAPARHESLTDPTRRDNWTAPYTTRATALVALTSHQSATGERPYATTKVRQVGRVT
jgi:hypothetical protein